MEVWRPGDYRVCPTCGMRHKVQDIKCARCKTILVGTKVHRATGAAVAVAGRSSPRGLRVLVAAGVVAALAAGWWVRSVFRGADIEDTVVAAEASLPAPRPAEPEWQPPVLSYPPIVGYNTGEPPSAAPLGFPDAVPPATGEPASGMVSITPSSRPLAQTSFTNDDLVRVRAGSGPDPAVTVPATPATPSPVRAAPATTSLSATANPVPVARAAAAGIPSAAVAEMAPAAAPSREARKWIARLRDRQEELQDAQARVRRAEVEADVRRARIGAAMDEDDREEAERDLEDALDDLEKAERTLARAQRELDETRDRAREEGVRVER